MNILKELRILPIWVNPQHLVSTAAHILAGHGVRALGVLEDERLVGSLSKEEVLRAPDGATVRNVMRPLHHAVDVGDTIRAVAALFVEHDLDYIPVLDQGRFVGIVTPNMLLRQMGRSFDPLTGLSWSDRLREWGHAHLERGDEVTIIFIDLNDFGQYNKKHGHIVGDLVIRRVAELLAESIDDERDVLVRYGGDEYAIGTLRHREGADVLTELIRRRVNGVVVEEGVEPVTFSMGVFGGRRTREREDTHFAATLDNLINVASRAALAAKKSAKRAPGAWVPSDHGESEPDADYRVVGVYADDQGARPVTTVILGMNDTIVSGAATQIGGSNLEAAAHATAKAIERARPEVSLKLEDLVIEEGVLRLRGRVHHGDTSNAISVAKPVGDDPLVTVAEATLEAIVGR